MSAYEEGWGCTQAKQYTLQALSHVSEEYGRLLDVVARYAILKEGVAFTCRRQVRY